MSLKELSSENDISEKCFWKRPADSDIEILSGEKKGLRTFNQGSECYRCKGYNTGCGTYVAESTIKQISKERKDL